MHAVLPVGGSMPQDCNSIAIGSCRAGILRSIANAAKRINLLYVELKICENLPAGKAGLY